MNPMVFLFPGQGSQEVGMGQDLFQEHAFVREIFEMTDEVCKARISRLCFQGPMEELTATVALQPAITAVNLSCLFAIRQLSGLCPAMAAGHSLGEYSALCCAGAFSAHDTLRLVFRRGELMHAASLENPGTMHAVMGLAMEQVQEITQKARAAGPVSVANHNTKTQIVITGSVPGVEKASEMAKQAGARVVPLPVSGAWHSQLMEKAAVKFADFLSTFAFHKPAIPVVTNVMAEPCEDGPSLAQIMSRQLISPVRWYDGVLAMAGAGARVFVEVGPKNVLSGMVKKILPRDGDFKIYSVGDLKSLEDFLKKEA